MRRSRSFRFAFFSSSSVRLSGERTIALSEMFISAFHSSRLFRYDEELRRVHGPVAEPC